MGPLDTIDFSGLDTTLQVADNMREAYGERFLAPQNLRALVARRAPRPQDRARLSQLRRGELTVPDTVAVSVEEGVATVTVANPPVNALDDATLERLASAARALAGDESVRAVVLTGAGDRAFLAGADLRSLQHALGTPGEMEAHVALTRPVFDGWRGLRQPVVAAVAANAVGGGLEFALVCDLIVADPRARFGLPEVTLGLMPGGGGTQRLPRRIGWTAASELLLLGRLVKAERARELGIVNVVAAEGQAREEADAIARRLADLPAVAVQAAKQAARVGLEAGLDEGLDAERALFLRVAASDDAREGAEAFLAKREPAFVTAERPSTRRRRSRRWCGRRVPSAQGGPGSRRAPRAATPVRPARVDHRNA